MFNKILAVLILVVCLCGQAFSQAPQKMNYQAVVRDASGKPLGDGKTVGLHFQIHTGSPTGTVVFQEEGAATTNQFGLIIYSIGTNGNLAVVDWSNGDKYLQVGVDINGGTNYVDMGNTQLLSVPYALFAANSVAGPPGATGPTGPTGSGGSGGGVTGPTGPSWNLSSTEYNSNGTLSIHTSVPDSVVTTKAAWLTTGNSGTTSGTNFIGTTDNQAFAIKTNGIGTTNERMRFTTGPQLMVNGTAPYSKAVMSVYGGGVTSVNNSIPGTTDIAIAAFNSDTNAAIYGVNTGGGKGLLGENLGGTGSGVEGHSSSNSGWGVIGRSYSNAVTPPSAILGYHSNGLSGTGVAGLGNGGGVYWQYVNGSGGSFTGKNVGVAGFAYNGNPAAFSAGGYFYDTISSLIHTYAYTACRIGGTNYKIIGDGTVSTIVKDMSDKPVIMFAPEAPEVLFQDYGEAVLVGGHAIVKLDPVYAKNILIDEKHPLRVIIQANGECQSLYVYNRTNAGFEVKEMNNGTSNIAFTYQVVANRANEIRENQVASEYANKRFPAFDGMPAQKAMPAFNNEQQTR